MLLFILIRTLTTIFITVINLMLFIVTYKYLNNSAFLEAQFGILHNINQVNYAFLSMIFPALIWKLYKIVLVHLDNIQTYYFTMKILNDPVSLGSAIRFANKEITSLTISSILNKKFVSVFKSFKESLFKNILSPEEETVTGEDNSDEDSKKMKKDKSFLRRIKSSGLSLKDSFATMFSTSQKKLFKTVTKIINREFNIALSFLDEVVVSYMSLQIQTAKEEDSKKKLTVKDKTIFMLEGMVLYLRALPKIMIRITTLDLIVIFLDVITFIVVCFFVIFILPFPSFIYRLVFVLVFHLSIKQVISETVSYSVRQYILLDTFYRTIATMEDIDINKDIIGLVNRVPILAPFKSKLGIKDDEEVTQESGEPPFDLAIDTRKIVKEKYIAFLNFFNIDDVDIDIVSTEEEVVEESNNTEDTDILLNSLTSTIAEVNNTREDVEEVDETEEDNTEDISETPSIIPIIPLETITLEQPRTRQRLNRNEFSESSGREL